MKKEQSVIIWILAALMVYNLFLNTKIRTNIQEYEDKIDNLQTKVDSVNLVNRQIDGKINSLHSQIEVIDSDISNVQASIKKIKQKTNEKVNSVDQFSFTDLEQFFSVRYQNRLDSIPTGTGSQISN
jgi:peptidoglycan hydrolase CwlO-like protein|tara:strand:- start:299 stop:679 length:381 start_codon:yes stop_codon:yes gene_type:complete